LPISAFISSVMSGVVAVSAIGLLRCFVRPKQYPNEGRP
jgi:hypothetical protein